MNQKDIKMEESEVCPMEDVTYDFYKITTLQTRTGKFTEALADLYTYLTKEKKTEYDITSLCQVNNDPIREGFNDIQHFCDLFHCNISIYKYSKQNIINQHHRIIFYCNDVITDRNIPFNFIACKLPNKNERRYELITRLFDLPILDENKFHGRLTFNYYQ
jgi:hypothetical protein